MIKVEIFQDYYAQHGASSILKELKLAGIKFNYKTERILDIQNLKIIYIQHDEDEDLNRYEKGLCDFFDKYFPLVSEPRTFVDLRMPQYIKFWYGNQPIYQSFGGDFGNSKQNNPINQFIYTCPKCNAKNINTVKYCIACGSSL